MKSADDQVIVTIAVKIIESQADSELVVGRFAGDDCVCRRSALACEARASPGEENIDPALGCIVLIGADNEVGVSIAIDVAVVVLAHRKRRGVGVTIVRVP